MIKIIKKKNRKKLKKTKKSKNKLKLHFYIGIYLFFLINENIYENILMVIIFFLNLINQIFF